MNFTIGARAPSPGEARWHACTQPPVGTLTARLVAAAGLDFCREWTTTTGPAAALGCAPRSNARRDRRSRRTEWLGLAPSRPREIGPGSSGDAWCSEGQCRIGGVRPAPLGPSRPTCERCLRCTKPACRVRAGRRRLERTTGASQPAVAAHAAAKGVPAPGTGPEFSRVFGVFASFSKTPRAKTRTNVRSLSARAASSF